MRTATILFVSGLAISVLATQASAAVITYTFTGTVADGYDNNHVFGARSQLTGERFTVVETFDPSLAYSVSTDGSSHSQQIGGSIYGAPQSATAEIKIGSGQFRKINDDVDSALSEAFYNSTSVSRVFGSDMGSEETVSLTISSPFISYDYGANFSASATDADVSFTGVYSIFDSSSAFGQNFDYDAYADFGVESVQISSDVTPVPLPATIPMFAMALSMLGIAQYRRKRTRCTS